MKSKLALIFLLSLLEDGLGLNFLDVCTLKRNFLVLDCSGKQLREVPHEFPTEKYPLIREIILNNNSISSINESCFAKFINVEVIRLIDNNLSEEKVHNKSFSGLNKLHSLHFDNNNFKAVPNLFAEKSVNTLEINGNNIVHIDTLSWYAFSYLKKLGLQNNKIKNINDDAFKYLSKKLTDLNLRGNELLSLPKSLRSLSNLQHLDIRDNNLKSLSENQFSGMYNLKELHIFNEDENHLKLLTMIDVHKNMIDVHKNTFRYLPALQTLFLHYPNCILNEFPDLEGSFSIERLSIRNITGLHIPSNFCDKMKKLHSIFVNNCTMDNFPSLNNCAALRTIDFTANQIKHITNTAFSSLPLIESIEVLESNNGILSIGLNAFSGLPSLKELKISHFDLNNFPNLTGTNSLQRLVLKFCKISAVPKNFCSNMKNLEMVDFSANNIKRLPDFTNCTSLKILHVNKNQITSIDRQFQNSYKLEVVDLNDNHISMIEENPFSNSTEIKEIHLSHNLISNIHDDIFQNIKSLNFIDLSFNKLVKIPPKSLKTVFSIRVTGNKGLIHFLTRKELPSAMQLDLVYPYHCCFFANKFQKPEQKAYTLSSLENYSLEINVEEMLRFHNNNTKLIFEEADHDLPDHSLLAESYCVPTPNDFYPCEDLFGENWLRACVWVVFSMALFGNLSVIFGLALNFKKLDIPQYLVLNLAFADLFLAIYLGFLAFVDIITLGDFRSHALEWQFSANCNAAGFLATFASELSVYTLVVITIERFTTIKYSMHYEKRMTKQQTAVIITAGWIFSFTLATLPLLQFGDIRFNDYTKYSVCLPLETEGILSKGYLTFIICFNLIAFLVILICYIKIYCYIHDSNAWNSRDSRAARRMAILVATDFLCWFPIALFSMSAIFQKPFVCDLWVSKVLTIFVFPINACTNPFLYAILTKKFRQEVKKAFQKFKDYSSQYERENRLSSRMSVMLTTIGFSLPVHRGSTCSFLYSRRSSVKNEDFKATIQALKLLQHETEKEYYSDE